MLRFITLSVLMAASRVCGAASITYVITEYTDSTKPKEIASGTRSYSQSDIQVKQCGSSEESFFSKSLELVAGYRIGASIYREKKIDGFGLWAKRDRRSFSWEWFDRPEGNVFKKLQEGGSVRVTFRDDQGLQALASITFESDVSLRIIQGNDDDVTYRILIKKGSVLEFPP